MALDEWTTVDQLPVFRSLVDLTGGKAITKVSAKRPDHGEWEVWANVEKVEQIGEGLFAARDFEQGDVIGLYRGRVIGRNDSTRAKAEVEASKSTKILELNILHSGETIYSELFLQSVASIRHRLAGCSSVR